MSDNVLSVFVSVISNLILAISVCLLWFQIKEMRTQIRSSTYQTIVQMFDEFSKIMLQHPDLASLLFGTSQPVNTIKAEWLVSMRLDWFESIVIQRHRYHAIPDDIYEHWMHVLTYELSLPFIQNVWEQYGSLYHPLLQQEVRQRLHYGDSR